MAEPISIQQLKDASEDAITLADFIYKPANVMIPRRLAADINSLQYYLDYMSSYAQHSYETYDEMVANAVNLPNGVSIFVTNDLDATKNGLYTYNGVGFVKGDYQPENAAKDYVEAKLGGLEVFDGKVRAQDVMTSSGISQKDFNSKTLLLSLHTSSDSDIKAFFSNDAANRVVDIDEITATDTLTIKGVIDCNNLTITAASDYPTNKLPMIYMQPNSSASNLVLDGGNFNVRGIDVTQGHTKLENVTLKNTQYLGINGLGDNTKNNIIIDGLYLYNVCSLGVPADLGYGGLALEFADGASISNVKMESIGAKGFRLRSCSNCTGDNHSYDDIQNDQGGIYFASGYNNNFTNIRVKNTRNPIKFSRGESNSSIRQIDIDNSHITDSTYSVVMLLQGTSNCTLSDFEIKKGNGYGIRVEPHPKDTDPLSEAPSISNTISNGIIRNKGDGYVLYSIRNSALMEMTGNTFRNINIDGGAIDGVSGFYLLRSLNTNIENLSITNNIGVDFTAGESSGVVSNMSISAGIGSSQRKVMLTGELDLMFNNPSFNGSTTADNFIYQNCTGVVSFNNLNKCNIQSANDAWNVLGVHYFNITNSLLFGGALKIGNNISGGVLSNVITEKPILDYSQVLKYSNYKALPEFGFKPQKVTLESVSLPANSHVDSVKTIQGAKSGQIINHAVAAIPNNFSSYSLEVFASGENEVTFRRINRTSGAVTATAITVNVS